MTDATQTPPGDNGQPAGAAEGERKYGGEFDSVEALEAAYAATKASKEPAKTGDLTITPDPQGDDANEQAAADALKSAGLDQDVFTKEFAETGTLGEDSLALLEGKGFPRAMVETYLEGLKSKQSGYEATLYAPAGGQEGYKQLIDWAGKNLDDADIEAFNAAVSSGNASQAKLAVAGLLSRKNTGKATLLNGKTSTADGVKPYESQAQVRAAINNPLYRTDPAYRRAHEARLAAGRVY